MLSYISDEGNKHFLQHFPLYFCLLFPLFPISLLQHKHQIITIFPYSPFYFPFSVVFHFPLTFPFLLQDVFSFVGRNGPGLPDPGFIMLTREFRADTLYTLYFGPTCSFVECDLCSGVAFYIPLRCVS